MPKKEKVDLRGERDRMRSDPKMQKLIKEAESGGYWNKSKDPEGDIAAVDRMMYDRNKPKRDAEEKANKRPYAKGGMVRGAGKAQKGVRKCKMR